MSELKKINIYVGAMGSTYIDKTSAQITCDNANKNVVDTRNLLDKAIRLKTIIQGKIDESTSVYDAAVDLGEQLKAAITANSSNAYKYSKLKEIQSALLTNDNDGDNTNGGNVITAQLNLTNANNQLEKINSIIDEATTLLEEYNTELLTRITEKENTQKEFNNHNINVGGTSTSGQSEDGSLDNQIDDIISNIDDIDNTNEAVSNTTEETINEINNVINGEDPEPETPGGVTKYWYLGQDIIPQELQQFTITSDMITDNIVDTWHIVKSNLTKDKDTYIIKGIDSSSTNKVWYLIIPVNPELTPVKSDLTTADSRFTFVKEISVNGSPYNIYKVINNSSIFDDDYSRFNIILKFGKVTEEPQPQPIDPQPETHLYWYIGKGPVNGNTTPGEGDGWTLIEGTPESIETGYHEFTPELIGGEHYTQEEIDAAQEGDDAYGKTIEDWKVEPTEIKSINWVIAVPTSLGLNTISNGDDLNDFYTISTVVCADGIEYKVFIQDEPGKRIDVSIVQ